MKKWDLNDRKTWEMIIEIAEQDADTMIEEKRWGMAEIFTTIATLGKIILIIIPKKNK